MTQLWDTDDDWARLVDTTGSVSDGLGDHGSLGDLSHGYEYGSLTDGLVAYYPMDEGQGQVLHDGALDHLGQINGATWNGSGQVGSDCLSFDGTDDYVLIGDEKSIKGGMAGGFTVSCWVQFSADADGWFFAEGSSANNDVWTLDLADRDSDSTREVRFYIDNGSNNDIVDNSFEPSTGIWYHIVGVWDGSTARLFADGTERASSSVTGSLATSVSPITVGCRGDGDGQFLNGLVDHAMIHDRALSQPEIETLANLTSTQGREVTESDVPSDGDSGTSRYEFSSGSLTTDSWGSNTLTDNTSAGTATGVFGQAKSFDGTDDRMECPDLGLSSSSSFTISSWAKTDGSSQFHTIVGRYDGTDDIMRLRIQDTGEFDFRVGHAGGNDLQALSSTTASGGDWHHVVGVFKSSGPTVEVYADGKLLDSATGTVDNFATTDGPWIGYRNDSNHPFSGDIDDVRIYSKALSPTEVEQLYSKGAWRIPRGDIL